MTNADISKIVDTTDEWIVERTGIRARHIAAEDETTRTLAVQAARNALAHAGLTPADIDLVNRKKQHIAQRGFADGHRSTKRVKNADFDRIVGRTRRH